MLCCSAGIVVQGGWQGALGASADADASGRQSMGLCAWHAVRRSPSRHFLRVTLLLRMVDRASLPQRRP